MEQRRGEYQRELDAIDAEIRQRQAEHRAVEDMMHDLLTDLQIQILDLHYREDRTYDYIAGKLTYSWDGVRKQEYKAIGKLSARLDNRTSFYHIHGV